MEVSIRVKDVIEHYLSGISHVDCSYLQGRDAILKQLQARSGQNEETRADAFIANAQNVMVELVRKSAPYTLPDDYLFFLKYYGGLFIERDSHYFQILGIGPMVEEWYAGVESDAAIVKSGNYGLLSIGSLSFRAGKYKFQHVDFLLDLAGVIQKHSVIGIGPWGKEEFTPLDVINDFSTYSTKWKIIANSFIEWLEQAAETQGIFIYT